MSNIFDDVRESDTTPQHAEEWANIPLSHHGGSGEPFFSGGWALEPGTIPPADFEMARKAIIKQLSYLRRFHRSNQQVTIQGKGDNVPPTRTHSDDEEKRLSRGQVDQLSLERDKLREERNKLAIENQFLRSRVAELGRLASRETHRYDQLLSGHNVALERSKKDQQTIDNLVQSLVERGRSNDCLLSGFITRPGSRVRMCQTYEGIVENVHNDRVVVIYNVDGDVVEQTYEKNQFVDGLLPCSGVRLAVFVSVAEVQPRSVAPPEESIESDERAISRREPLSGPTEF